MAREESDREDLLREAVALVERVELRVGQPVLDAVFIEGAGGRAVFKIGEVRFELDVNQTLDQRKPIG